MIATTGEFFRYMKQANIFISFKELYMSPIKSSKSVPESPALSPVPTPPLSTPTIQSLAPGDERTWGMLSHLSVILNLVTGFGGPIAAFIIYLVYKERSRFVAYHALQSLVFQLNCGVGGGAIAGIAWAISGVLTTVVIGLFLMPVACALSLLPLGGFIYSIIGAVKVNQGEDFKYWLVGDWMRGTLTGI
jgi:uncharacterized Tic20 family protein